MKTLLSLILVLPFLLGSAPFSRQFSSPGKSAYDMSWFREADRLNRNYLLIVVWANKVPFVYGQKPEYDGEFENKYEFDIDFFRTGTDAERFMFFHPICSRQMIIQGNNMEILADVLCEYKTTIYMIIKSDGFPDQVLVWNKVFEVTRNPLLERINESEN